MLSRLGTTRKCGLDSWYHFSLILPTSKTCAAVYFSPEPPRTGTGGPCLNSATPAAAPQPGSPPAFAVDLNGPLSLRIQFMILLSDHSILRRQHWCRVEEASGCANPLYPKVRVRSCVVPEVGESPLFGLWLYCGRLLLFKKQNFMVGVKIHISSAARGGPRTLRCSMLCALNSDGRNERRVHYNDLLLKVSRLEPSRVHPVSIIRDGL